MSSITQTSNRFFGAISSALSGLRLCFVMSITGAMSFVCLLGAMLGLASPQFIGRYSQLWALRILRWCGIEVNVKGGALPEGCLLVANHRSYTDIPALMSTAPCTFLAKHEVKSWPVIGWGARLANTVFVDRGCKTSRREARNTLKDRLDQGMSVMVFAEGTTVPQGGLMPLKPGMFHVAAERGLPIVPVAIEYREAEDAWVGDDTFIGHFLKRFRRSKMQVDVSFGPVIRGSDGEGLRAITQDWLREELQALNAPAIAPTNTNAS